MHENKISWARVSKNICYFIVPIFGLILIACIAGLVIIDTDIELETTTKYFDSKIFSDNYLNSIRNYKDFPYILVENEEGLTGNTEETGEAIDEIEYSQYYIVSKNSNIQENADINGKNGTIYYSTRDNSNFKYLIIDEKHAIAVTNLEHTMKTDTIEEIKALIKENSVYWNYNKGKIDTSISNLSLEEIRYTNIYKQMQEGNTTQMYTSLVDKLPYKDDYRMGKIGYELSMNSNEMAPILIPFSLTVLLALGLIILNGIGKKGKGPGIHLNGFDKFPLELSIVIGVGIILLGGCSLIVLKSEIRAIIYSGITIGAIISYLGAILILETIVKRLKTHTLWHTSILYMIGHGIKELIDNWKISIKLSLFFWGFCIIALIATVNMINSYDDQVRVFCFVVLAMLGIGTFITLFKKIKQYQTIQDAVKSIYEGNTNINLNKDELTGTLKQLAIYVEDIAGGLSNALEQNLKSERLKTELITNVSHDIKTPLTSIINYVDLLKKEEMPNEKCKEYLSVLDNKSQRLKKLTEDLVEASKASTGSIKLKKEKIAVKELIKQVSGEFEDRFKTRGLEEVMTLPEEELIVEADGRYMYRILENIYSNASKYALENTRVYVDVISQKTSIIIQMKNISKEKLNISTDELMQRFVRGDSSRNTEGSGLGLSIAESLTQLQGGKFHIYLDGDLFKVTLGFEKIDKV